jgi:hypothetical protein
MPHVRVWVDDAEVLGEMSDKELLAELVKRKAPVPVETDDGKNALDRIFYALYFGKESEAIALMRKYVQDVTGKTLP